MFVYVANSIDKCLVQERGDWLAFLIMFRFHTSVLIKIFYKVYTKIKNWKQWVSTGL